MNQRCMPVCRGIFPSCIEMPLTNPPTTSSVIPFCCVLTGREPCSRFILPPTPKSRFQCFLSKIELLQAYLHVHPHMSIKTERHTHMYADVQSLWTCLLLFSSPRKMIEGCVWSGVRGRHRDAGLSALMNEANTCCLLCAVCETVINVMEEAGRTRGQNRESACLTLLPLTTSGSKHMQFT